MIFLFSEGVARMAFKKWNVAAAQKEAAKELAQLCDADGLVALIAINRGVDTPEKLLGVIIV